MSTKAIQASEYSDKQKALAKYLECDPSELIECTYNEGAFEYDGGEYLVLTDSEADDAWEESLDSYIDECIMPELKNETLKQYFDTDMWKRDAKFDGRGHSLSSYDGNEIELENNLFAYRTN